MFSKISGVLIILFGCSILPNVASLQSRAIQNFGVNCQLNQYASMEFDLAITYLNASIYMSQDRVALHGFGLMFKKFWHGQVANMVKIQDYVVKRGGVVNTPGVKSQFFNNLNSINYFQNESMLMTKFLEEELQLMRRLTDLHISASVDNRIEKECIIKFGGVQLSDYLMTEQLDPYTANFLDENFMKQKIEKIKFLADLLRKVNRFDQHPKNIPGVTHYINPLGIHMLDLELQEQFS